MSAFELTDEQQQFRAAARRMAEEKILPNAAEADENRRIRGRRSMRIATAASSASRSPRSSADKAPTR
jgi:alkylation response protein AidB-like acyl-CoA dehydrogenase